MQAQEIMHHMDQKGLFFPIHEQPAYFEVMDENGKPFDVPSYQEVANRKLLMNNKNKVIGLVSKQYRTVTNEEIEEKFVKQLCESSINRDGMTIDCRYANDGARSMVQMKFPAHEIDVKGDKSILEIVTKNSYDGMWKFSVRGGACRMACLNGMLLGAWAAAYSEQHNSKLSITHAAKKIVTILDDFIETPKQWADMMDRPVDDTKAWKVIRKYNKHDDREIPMTWHRNPGTGKVCITNSDTRMAVNGSTRMMDHYLRREAKDIGKNAFALYNTLTHQATHGTTTDRSEAITLDNRMRSVARVLDSRYWKWNIMGWQ